jgi:hypothetical protein
MNFGMIGGPFLLILLWLAGWIFGIYLALRLLRAIERGVAAHERIADALGRSTREPPGPRF